MPRERITELLALPCVIPDAATARKFAKVDDDVQALVHSNDAAIVAAIAITEAHPLSEPDNVPSATIAELASAFNVIRGRGGSVDGAGLSRFTL